MSWSSGTTGLPSIGTPRSCTFSAPDRTLQGHLGSLPPQACPPGPGAPGSLREPWRSPQTRPLASSLAPLPSDPRAEQPPGSLSRSPWIPRSHPLPSPHPTHSFQMRRAHVGLPVGGPPNPHALLRLAVTPESGGPPAACPAARSLQARGRKMRICVRPRLSTSRLGPPRAGRGCCRSRPRSVGPIQAETGRSRAPRSAHPAPLLPDPRCAPSRPGPAQLLPHPQPRSPAALLALPPRLPPALHPPGPALPPPRAHPPGGRRGTRPRRPAGSPGSRPCPRRCRPPAGT